MLNEASTCRLLTPSSVCEAAKAWALVVNERSLKLKLSLPWYLHAYAAACESRLCFHAEEPVGEDPNNPLTASE